MTVRARAAASVIAKPLVPTAGAAPVGRGARGTVAPLLLAALLAPAGARAQEPGVGGQGSADPLVKIAPHAWAWIATDERSSNSALFVGDSIALVVDPGLTPGVAREFLAAVRTVTDRPVRYAVLTHWHPDHALGVTCMRGRPFTVVSHPWTRRVLAERGARVAVAAARAAPTAAERETFASCRPAPPDSTVADRTAFDLGRRRVEVFPTGPAHTPGDLVVWEPGERVLVTGDIFMHEASPDMDEGSPRRWAEVLDSLVSLSPSAVVAGHFGPSRPTDLKRFRDYMHALVGRVTAALAAGVPPDSVPARVRLPEFADFGQYPQYNATFAGNAEAVVREWLRAKKSGGGPPPPLWPGAGPRPMLVR
ncbi:MAG: MBL fold metallo-hydrolase [Gemmatimonadota bacterium]